MSKPHILVVDDRANMLHLLEKVLRENATVHTAGSGSEAVAILEGRSVSAVVCDLRMPDMSGIDVLRASKRLQPGAEFVLMTAYATVPTAVEAMREGAYDYVTKPFDPESLRALVLRALSRAYGWPGNGRQLRSAIERASIEAGAEPLDVRNLPPEVTATGASELSNNLVSMKWHEAMALGRRETGRQYLQAVLKRYAGRIAEAAVHAGVERESFYRLLRRYGVQLDGNSVAPEK